MTIADNWSLLKEDAKDTSSSITISTEGKPTVERYLNTLERVEGDWLKYRAGRHLYSADSAATLTQNTNKLRKSTAELRIQLQEAIARNPVIEPTLEAGFSLENVDGCDFCA